MALNTILGLTNETVYAKVNGSEADPTKVEPNDQGELTLPWDEVLYVTVSYSIDTSFATTGPPPQTRLPWFKQTIADEKLTWTDWSVASAATYFVPHMPNVMQYEDIASAATHTARAAAETSSNDPVSQTLNTSDPSVVSFSSSVSADVAAAASSSALHDKGETVGKGDLNTSDPSVVSFSSSVSADVAAAASSSVPSDKGETFGKGETVGAAVGGSVGGLLVGITIALIALACLRRRRSHGSGKHTHRSKSSDGDTDTRGYPMSKEMQALATTTTVTGWQKHLPQEKDDVTISKAVKTIFDQIQMHMEGFYNSKPRKLTGSAAAALERVSPDGLSRKLSKAPDCLLILEGILIRWIVHRISLRSDAGESFLPFEYTKIPEQNNWHMESEEGHGGQTEEPKKGFSQAFSQWRVLTAFLHPDSRADQASKKHLNVKIDLGVRALTDAFAPWDIPGRSITNRNESLRRILQLASDAGLMLFAQPSTFVFNWSSRQGTVTVSPALVKRLDEAAELLPSPVVLIAAKRVDA